MRGLEKDGGSQNLILVLFDKVIFEQMLEGGEEISNSLLNNEVSIKYESLKNGSDKVHANLINRAED